MISPGNNASDREGSRVARWAFFIPIFGKWNVFKVAGIFSLMKKCPAFLGIFFGFQINIGQKQQEKSRK